MKKTAVTLLILLFTTMLFVPNTFAQQVVTIPDANLREVIRDALGLPPGAAITSDAMLKLTELLTWGSVTDLTGLEYATNLTGLNLDNQPISNLSPIAGLIQLEWLGLSHTDVSDISPLASLSQLRSLDLGKFRSRNLDTGASESLRLFYGHTDVSDISPLASLTQLERLFLGHTGISDISPLASLSQLRSLDLRSTDVSDISPLASLTQLVKLNLVDCPLNADAHQTHIPAIQANGTEVAFDPFKPIHLPRAPWLVSLIYFRPSDVPVRPNVDAEIDALIKKAQRFFADQLELHGFGRKTFQFETDAHGNAVVHHVNGKFPRMHYVNNGKYKQEIKGQIYISQKKSVPVYMLGSDPWFFTEWGGIGGGGNYGGFAEIDDWHWKIIAHELAHAFGLQHDWRTDANAKRIRTFTDDRMLTSFCAAEWLSVHPAFNPGQPVSTSNATIKMLPPTLASPPNTIRLRFEVTDLDGLHQAQLQIPDFVVYSGQYKHMVDCKRLHGRHSTVEFVTTKLTPQIEGVTLSVIDVRGHMSTHSFLIDVPSLLPPAKVVSIPDPNLALAVREALELSVSEAITTHAMLPLRGLWVPNRGIKDLTGLEHATNLTALDLSWVNTSGGGFVDSNAISDWSPLAGLTQLERLDLSGTAVLDISPLASLTQLKSLDLTNTGVSDISPLASLTQLRELNLSGTGVSDISSLTTLTQLRELNLTNTGVSDISSLTALAQLTLLFITDTDVADVSPLLGMSLGTVLLEGCPLSYASIHTHIPAMQAKGIEVEFDNVAHPALLKTYGDGQEGAPGAMLKTPFVVEAMDEHGKPIVGKTVQFSVLGGEGTLSAKTVKTNARGKAQVTLTLGWYPDVNKVKATSKGIQSWVLFTAVGTEEVQQLVADVNGDGSVNIQDLMLVAGQFGETGKNSADVNGDGVVNIQDLVLVAGAFGEGAAAPSARAVSLSRLTVSDVEGWLIEARGSIRSGSGDPELQSGRVGQDRLILTSFSRQTHLLSNSGSGDPELQSGSASRPGGLAYLRGLSVLEQLLASLMPKATALLPNYPNPFNPETWIPYQLANPAEVTVTIYAANGAVVRMLDLGHRRAGSYASQSRAAHWDGRNAHGEPVASGVYFYTLSAGDFSGTRKMLILK